MVAFDVEFVAAACFFKVGVFGFAVAADVAL
jgi:hypothetical protein